MKYILLVFIITTCFSVSSSCVDNIADNAPNNRYINNSDGTVTDLKTNLMWTLCPAGLVFNGSECNGELNNFNWLSAHQYANDSSLAGYENWRVPNIKELMSLIKDSCSEPSINSEIFVSIPDVYFWTSSNVTGESNRGKSYFVSLHHGFFDHSARTNENAVLLVRTP